MLRSPSIDNTCEDDSREITIPYIIQITSLRLKLGRIRGSRSVHSPKVYESNRMNVVKMVSRHTKSIRSRNYFYSVLSIISIISQPMRWRY